METQRNNPYTLTSDETGLFWTVFSASWKQAPAAIAAGAFALGLRAHRGPSHRAFTINEQRRASRPRKATPLPNKPKTDVRNEPRLVFPFRPDTRRPDGFWDAPDATRDNTRGTSVDLEEPAWPRWRTTPGIHEEGDFISEDPFFDIDEITQKAEFYPPGKPLTDRNMAGNPASRQRVNDSEAGNPWRRRLTVAPKGASDSLSEYANAAETNPGAATSLRRSSPGTVDLHLGFVPLGPGSYHAYNILTGPNGETYAVRGGPMNSYGDPGKPSGALPQRTMSCRTQLGQRPLET